MISTPAFVTDDHINVVVVNKMGRGKQWTDTETKALIQVYIHVSEDSLVGTNQTSEQLYQCVNEEAKKRFDGGWARSPDASKKRRLDVSKEVQRFCAAMKFIKSVECSGWNDDDYFNAAEEYYCTCKGDEGDSFKFVNEWQFLKNYEKWKTMSTLPQKRTKEQSSSSDSSDSDCRPTPHPMGNKKAKALAALETKGDEWMDKIVSACGLADNNTAMLDIMKENVEQSKQNRVFLKEVMEAQTDKSAKQLQKSTTLKALTKLDLSTSFQERAQKKIEDELSSILEF